MVKMVKREINVESLYNKDFSIFIRNKSIKNKNKFKSKKLHKCYTANTYCICFSQLKYDLLSKR